MRKLLLIVLMACSFSGMAFPGSTGIRFEQGLNWKQALEKAKNENKYVFIDAYTTWCGPCKLMAKTIFPLQEVGDFFNDRFINLKVQLDTSRNDDDGIKAWYADARQIQQQYGVRVFPTYLYLSPEGKLVHRAVGYMDAASFIEKSKNALDSNKQYYTLQAKYAAGQRSPELLRQLMKGSAEAYDQDYMKAYADDYYATQTNLLTEENIRLFRDFTYSSADKGFEMMMKHGAEFDKFLGKGFARNRTRMIVLQDDIYPVLVKSRGAVNQETWTMLEQQIKTKYPTLSEELIAYSRINHLMQQGEWDEFTKRAGDYVGKYGNELNASDLNSFAWAIFENCSDANVVEQAVKWAKKASELEADANYADTYANLLYKSGKRQEAIRAQEKTVALAKKTKNSNLSDFESSLQKMKKGVKTW